MTKDKSFPTLPNKDRKLDILEVTSSTGRRVPITTESRLKQATTSGSGTTRSNAFKPYPAINKVSFESSKPATSLLDQDLSSGINQVSTLQNFLWP